MGYEGMDVSSLFNAPRRKAARLPSRAVPVQITLPELGSGALEEVDDSLRLWLADGTSMLVPKSAVRVVSRNGRSVTVDWCAERVHLEFSGTVLAWKASMIMGSEQAAPNERERGLASQ